MFSCGLKCVIFHRIYVWTKAVLERREKVWERKREEGGGVREKEKGTVRTHGNLSRARERESERVRESERERERDWERAREQEEGKRAQCAVEEVGEGERRERDMVKVLGRKRREKREKGERRERRRRERRESR
eukprot:928342-Amorphochlora_amoeboformis.AAC.1